MHAQEWEAIFETNLYLGLVVAHRPCQSEYRLAQNLFEVAECGDGSSEMFPKAGRVSMSLEQGRQSIQVDTNPCFSVGFSTFALPYGRPQWQTANDRYSRSDDDRQKRASNFIVPIDTSCRCRTSTLS